MNNVFRCEVVAYLATFSRLLEFETKGWRLRNSLGHICHTDICEHDLVFASSMMIVNIRHIDLKCKFNNH